VSVSAEKLRKVEFREGWRGYSPVDVDVFLEEVAAGVDELHAELAESRSRAERAEARIAASGASPETDETVRRTLTLAQRAADLVVGESKAVGERILADARAQAAKIAADAELAAVAARDAAERDARATIDARQKAADADHERVMSGLIAQRETLAADVETRRRELDDVRSLASATRDRLRAALTDHLARLDHLETIDIETALEPVLGN
jgi:DivIVA domain-containing protein